MECSPIWLAVTNTPLHGTPVLQTCNDLELRIERDVDLRIGFGIFCTRDVGE